MNNASLVYLSFYFAVLSFVFEFFWDCPLIKPDACFYSSYIIHPIVTLLFALFTFYLLKRNQKVNNNKVRFDKTIRFISGIIIFVNLFKFVFVLLLTSGSFLDLIFNLT